MKLTSLILGLSLAASSVFARGVGMEMPRIIIPRDSELLDGNGFRYYWFSNKDNKTVYIAYPVCDGKMLEKPFGILLENSKRAVFYVDRNPYDGFIDEVIDDYQKLMDLNVPDYLPCAKKI